MLDLESIVARWVLHAECAPVHKHPDVWVAHFDDGSLLGSLAATSPNSIGNAVLFLASPYALCLEVEECAVVVDVNHVLHVTHFAHYRNITRTIDYHIPYHINDYGEFLPGDPVKAPSAVWGECHIIHEQRSMLRGSYPFADAFKSALVLGEKVL